MWKQVILVIVDFHRVNFVNCCCSIYEVAVCLAQCVGITSLTGSLSKEEILTRYRVGKEELGEKTVLERK